MLYELPKAGHLVSMFVWTAGMVPVALALATPARAHLEKLRAYDRAVTTPAMLLTWTFGILLAVQGGWFADLWLAVKILLVLGLSGLHGALTGRLRRATHAGSPSADTSGRRILPIGFALLILIVLLVTTKPL